MPGADDAHKAIRRIAIEAALRPGIRDPLALLLVWFVRKSFFWLLWVGFIVGAILAGTDEVRVDDGADGIWTQLLSPFAGVILALMLRFGSSLAGLALAYPLAREHYAELEPQTGFGSQITTWLDRMQVARAFRSLRWTHHVRQLAIARLGTTGTRLARLDPILDVANIALFIALVVVVALVGAEA